MIYSYQENDDLYQGSKQVPNGSQASTLFRQQTFRIGYEAIESLQLNLSVPRVEVRQREKGNEILDLQGLGDISFYADWGPWRRREESESPEQRLFGLQGLSLLAGVEFPTGEDEKTPIVGVATPSLLQLGSGTFDPILGVRYYGRRGAASVFHETSIQVPLGESDAGLNPGDVLNISTGAGYTFFRRVTVSLSFEALFLGREELKGTRIENTGSSFLFLTPGISFQIYKTLSMDVTDRLPVYRNVISTQLTPGELWSIGLSWSF